MKSKQRELSLQLTDLQDTVKSLESEKQSLKSELSKLKKENKSITEKLEEGEGQKLRIIKEERDEVEEKLRNEIYLRVSIK